MRRHGLGAIHKHKQTNALYKEKSDEISKEQIKKLTEQIDKFKVNLEEFANKHKKEIKKNAEFRKKFQEMCAYIGVDPLQSSNNFWSKLLGVGDFYYELGIQIIEICMANNKNNGGIMRLSELITRIQNVRQSKRKIGQEREEISADDIFRAINKLHVLGNGLKLVKIDKTKHEINNYVIESIARELSEDDTVLLKLSEQNSGKISFEIVSNILKWSENRFKKVINYMLMEGMVWLDKYSNQTYFWFPGLFSCK